MVLSACSKNPTEPDQPGGSEFAQIASTNGAEVFRGVQTLATLRRAQAGPRAYGKINLPAVGSMANSGRMLGERLAPFHQSAAKLQSLRKANGDSLIYEEWKIDLLTGINYHTRLYYDFATGKARLVVVASNFPATEPVVRDSAHIVVQTNFTLPDTADDVVERVDVRRDYRANYRLQFESGTLVPDAYEPGGEPAGGMIDARRVFAANQDSAEAVYHLEYHAGTGGNFSESVRFEDGTRYQANARFTEGQVLITINFRDGAVEQSDVTLEGPNRLRFNKTVTFAPGADPRSLYESGDLAVNPADSSATANFRREIFYANGTSLREELQASETRHNGLRRVTVSASSSKGTSCDWVWQEGVEKDRLEGSAIDEQQHYILFSGDFYRDGSADLHLEVYASKAAYDAGEPPIFTADLHYRPDGSGSGTVNSREGVKTFHFDANASLRS
jgi:hypothetical protein